MAFNINALGNYSKTFNLVPTVPSLRIKQLTSTSVELRWLNVPNATQYLVYRVEASAVKTLATVNAAANSTTDNVCVDSAAVVGSSYVYVVVARTKFGLTANPAVVGFEVLNVSPPPPPPPTNYATLTFDANGNHTVTYKGTKLMDNQGISFYYGISDANGQIVSGTETPTIKWDAATSVLSFTYTWGVVKFFRTLELNQIRFKVTVQNNSTKTVDSLYIVLGIIKTLTERSNFPPTWPYFSSTINPGVLPFVMKDTNENFCVCDENPIKEKVFGTTHPAPGETEPLWQELFMTTNNGWLGGFNTGPYVKGSKIAPGSTDTLELTWRFGVTQAPDILQKYAAAYPQTLNWTDRRPILPVFLNYAGDMGPVGNLPRPASEFIQTLKDGNYQGLVLWDAEGYLYGLSYVGDPRWLPVFNPQVDAVMDAWIKAIVDAGFKVGFTLRADQVTKNADGSYSQVGIAPDKLAQSLADRINYCTNRWGAKCCLFYLDSNNGSIPFPMRDLNKLCPNALVMPENHYGPGYYPAASPYFQTRNGIGKMLEDSAVRDAIYPKAFNMIWVDDDANLAAIYSQLVALVKKGDILMGRDPAFMKKVYTDAAKV